jgi:hypothetical protein
VFYAETPLGHHLSFPWGTSILGVFEKPMWFDEFDLWQEGRGMLMWYLRHKNQYFLNVGFPDYRLQIPRTRHGTPPNTTTALVLTDTQIKAL